jgi:hypothetical protein
MLNEQQRVGDPFRAPILHQPALQRERFSVRHQAESAYIKGTPHLPCLPHPP